MAIDGSITNSLVFKFTYSIIVFLSVSLISIIVLLVQGQHHGERTEECVDTEYTKLGAVFINKCSAVVRISAGIKTEHNELVVGT